MSRAKNKNTYEKMMMIYENTISMRREQMDIKKNCDETMSAVQTMMERMDDLYNLVRVDYINVIDSIDENKMKTIYNMLTIEKAMLELNYDVNVSENPNGEDGYCVECSAGDECITFDKVSVVDDGRVIITIDHKEATKGTCAASWDEIRKKLAENELFIEDITKNGKSIHGANREVQGHKNESTVKQNLSR